MIRSFFLIGLLSFNLSAENNEKALKQSLLKFWEARNTRDFETIFFYESKIGAITGSSSENYFYEDPPPNFDSVIDYYCLDTNTRLYITTGKKEFYQIEQVIPSLETAINIFQENNVDPWFA